MLLFFTFPSLGSLKEALGYKVMMVGLDDSKGLFQMEQFYHLMIKSQGWSRSTMVWTQFMLFHQLLVQLWIHFQTFSKESRSGQIGWVWERTWN